VLRTLFLTALMLPIIPMALIVPYVGILAWTWISIMNPHLLAVGYLSSFPLLDILGGLTIFAWLASNEQKKIPAEPIVWLILVYLLWVSITTIFAQDLELASGKLSKFSKIILLVIMTAIMTNTRERLLALVALLTVSVGFWSVWGGVGTIANLGRYVYSGPEGTMIGDRNHLALTMAMTAPLMMFIGTQMTNKWLRWAAYAGAALTILGVMGTQSRGGLVSLAAMALFLIIRSRHRFQMGIASAIIGVGAFAVADQAWVDRMVTIENYQEDASAAGRFQMWRYGMEIAKEFPLTGAGFRLYHNGELAAGRLPDGMPVRASHSIFFEVLGEHAYIGLFLFLTLAAAGFLTCWRIRSLVKQRPDLDWARKLALGLEVSLIAYLTGGAFLEVAIFDYYYTLLAVIAITHAQVKRELAKEPGTSPLILDNLFPWVGEGGKRGDLPAPARRGL
jgi:probable O-glycosylation ligase (exosortase A-associated)